MKKDKHLRTHIKGLRSASSESAAMRRFQTRYGKPKTLTDRYDECSDEAIARVLGKPEAGLTWSDFNMLFRVGVAPATYEEGLFFLPAAFAFLRRPSNPDSVDCVADPTGSNSARPRRKKGRHVSFERQTC